MGQCRRMKTLQLERGLSPPLVGASPQPRTSPLYCPLCAFCTRRPDGILAPELYIFKVCRAAWTHRLDPMCIVPHSLLTRPLWKADVHNTRHIHLEPGHLVGSQGTRPWVWLMTISVPSVRFVFPFSFPSWTFNPAYDSIGFETYMWHWQVKQC